MEGVPIDLTMILMAIWMYNCILLPELLNKHVFMTVAKLIVSFFVLIGHKLFMHFVNGTRKQSQVTVQIYGLIDDLKQKEQLYFTKNDENWGQNFFTFS